MEKEIKMQMEEIIDSKTIKIKRLKKLLSCTFCKPHRGENRTKIVKYKTRKSRNYQLTRLPPTD